MLNLVKWFVVGVECVLGDVVRWLGCGKLLVYCYVGEGWFSGVVEGISVLVGCWVVVGG